MYFHTTLTPISLTGDNIFKLDKLYPIVSLILQENMFSLLKLCEEPVRIYNLDLLCQNLYSKLTSGYHTNVK